MFEILEDVLLPIFIIGCIFVAAPWIILHYVTRWKMQGTLTKEDENLLDDLYELSRRLEERVVTIERILSADNPGWRTLSVDPAGIGIEDETSANRSMK
jgi:phage shock protein B